MVLRGLTTIWSLATFPTSRSPLSPIATTLGRISDPLSLGTTRATLLRTYATQVLVVPRSMPSRMGLSEGIPLPGCYGAPRLERNKSPRCPTDVVSYDYTSGRGFEQLRRTHLAPYPRARSRKSQCAAKDVQCGVERTLERAP